MKKKIKTFIYEGLGFPVELIDINMKVFQEFVFRGLIHKHSPLSGKEIRFMRKFLQISSTEFGKRFGISHATVVKWEKQQVKVSPLQESYIRMFLFEHFQNNELISLYQEIRPEKLADARHKKQSTFTVDANQFRDAI